MKRSHAFLLSAFLTVLVIGAFFILDGRVRAGANPTLPVASTAEAIGSDSVETYQAQERVLQATVADLQSTLATMDADHAAQVEPAQEALAITQLDITEQEETIAAIEAEQQRVQTALNQSTQGYDQQLAGLQANEAQLRQQLEVTLASLQAAYNDLAIQQAALAVSSGGGDSGGESYSDDDADYDEDHDDDDDDDDDDEHEDREREHDDDEDDD